MSVQYTASLDFAELDQFVSTGKFKNQEKSIKILCGVEKLRKFSKKFGEIGKVKDLVLDGFLAGLEYRSGENTQAMRKGISFTTEMVVQHEIIDQFIESLADQESKQVICWLIRFRAALSIIGDKEIILEQFFPSAISSEKHAELIEAAKKLPEAKLDHSLPVDLIENFLLGGYSIPGVCEAVSGDIVFDVGVFNGNSIIDLARRVGDDGQVIGFEPNPVVSAIARKNLKKMGTRAKIETAAVGERVGELRFRKAGAASRVDPNGDISVPCVTVDGFLADQKIANLAFLKLDIEGHEVQALKGAKDAIERLKPKIAVCIYHLATDLTLIPALISGYHSGYRFYVRHRARHDGEVVMFCVP